MVADECQGKVLPKSVVKDAYAERICQTWVDSWGP